MPLTLLDLPNDILVLIFEHVIALYPLEDGKNHVMQIATNHRKRIVIDTANMRLSRALFSQLRNLALVNKKVLSCLNEVPAKEYGVVNGIGYRNNLYINVLMHVVPTFSKFDDRNLTFKANIASLALLNPHQIRKIVYATMVERLILVPKVNSKMEVFSSSEMTQVKIRQALALLFLMLAVSLPWYAETSHFNKICFSTAVFSLGLLLLPLPFFKKIDVEEHATKQQIRLLSQYSLFARKETFDKSVATISPMPFGF